MTPPTIETRRLLLRPFCEADLARLVEIAGQRQVADTTISVPHPFTEQHGREWIARCTDTGAHFAITLRNFGDSLHNLETQPPATPEVSRLCRLSPKPSPKLPKLIGYVGITSIEREHSQGELTFWLDTAVAHAFGALGLNRVCAFYMVRNPASSRALTRAGFREEGILRQRARKWSVYEDVCAAAILRDDPFLREAAPSDAHAISALLDAAFEEFRQLYTPDAFSATVPPACGILARLEEGPLWVVERRGSIVGTVAARCLPDSVLVRGMAVHPFTRGLGIAPMLLDEVGRFARQEGHALVSLYTTAFLTQAIRLYEKAGFRSTGETASLHGTALQRMVKCVIYDPP